MNSNGLRIFASMFRGPLVVLLLRLAAVFVVYSLTRILFGWNYPNLFQDAPLAVHLGGLRFDASAIAWTNLPWLLLILIDPKPVNMVFARIQFGLFMATNAIALFFQFVDLEYYSFSLKRSTADFLDILTTGSDTANLAPAFIRDYWYILLMYVGSLVALAWVYRASGRLMHIDPLPMTKRFFWRVMAISLFLLGSRGGTQLIPLQPLDAAQYGGASYLPMVLNTPFTILTSLGKSVLDERNYMTPEEADALWPVHHHYADSLDLPPRTNVAVIILESFSAAYSERLSGTTGYMPFIDSLMGESLNMSRAYANGRRSIDGIPAILASIPELMDGSFITSPYAGLPFTSLANVLASDGYATSFYHGGRNGTMGFDGFARSAGFERYKGLNEYTGNGADYDGHWGVRDRPYLQYWSTEMSSMREPFFSCAFTLSSHHPYELPQEESARFAGGTQAIHPTLRYTDDALRQFLATARKQPWFERTLFVITADHTADIDRSGQHYNKATDYWVPLLYYMPGKVVVREDAGVTQHIDILPTVLDMLGYKKPFFSFGQSTLTAESGHHAVMASNGIYTCINDHRYVQFDGTTVMGAYDLAGPVDGSSTDVEMVLRLQAAIQQFNGHMVRGELVHRP